MIFHFCGDGHLSLTPEISSSYTQLNTQTLKVVYNKLKNCFGTFRPSLNDGKLYIPKSITSIYAHIFNIKANQWYDSRIPLSIKRLPNEFLVAGLTAFMIDEANISEVIEIYSKNFGLLKDIREIALRCGYKCQPIRKKYRYGIFDSYRFLISSESYLKLYSDITNLKRNFPLCDLSHKNNSFYSLVKRKKRKFIKKPYGVTKGKIMQLLGIKPRTVSELSQILVIGNSSIRELLWNLEDKHLVKRHSRVGRSIVWST